MVEAIVSTLSVALRLIPDRLPGKTRLGRMLLRPFRPHAPAVLRDRAGCIYVLPSYAEPMAQQIFTFGGYEHGTQQTILKFLPERGSFVDVGANIGTLAIPIAKARPYASITCIEADPRIYRLLQENINRNGCGHVHLMSCVAGPTHDQVPFYQAPDDQFGMGSLGPQFNSAPVMLEQRSLDTILTAMNISRIDVIKIDVEGAEFGVLRGAERVLASERPPVIVFEFADWAETRIPEQHAGDAQEFLLGRGYHLFPLGAGKQPQEKLVAPLRHGSAMLLAIPPHMQMRHEL